MSAVESAVFVVPASTLGDIKSCLILAIFALVWVAVHDCWSTRQ